jgi:membrane protein YqaA with SNARE-associated domain
MLLSVIQAANRNRGGAMRLFRHFGALGLFALAILDSTPLPTFGGPDILIVILVVSHRNPWYEYPAAATAGSVVGAYITFTLARRAGRAYLDSKFGGPRFSKLLKAFERWGIGALIASAAIPFPLPTSLFFAAAGASDTYRVATFITVVAASRGFRYTVVAIIAEVYGRHVIRVLRHPMQHWGWLLLLASAFVALIVSGILVNRRIAQTSS